MNRNIISVQNFNLTQMLTFYENQHILKKKLSQNDFEKFQKLHDFLCKRFYQINQISIYFMTKL